ncbi:hypothetical protein Tco_0000606 [Tanacetum coccineum]
MDAINNNVVDEVKSFFESAPLPKDENSINANLTQQRFETNNGYVAPYDDEESSSSGNMLKMRLKERKIQRDLNSLADTSYDNAPSKETFIRHKAKQSHVVVSKEVIPEIKSADIMFHEWKMSKAGIINKGFMKMIGLKKSSKHGKVCAKTNNFSFLKPVAVNNRVDELIQSMVRIIMCIHLLYDSCYLNEKQQQSVFCELLLILFGEQVEKTIETTYTTNPRSTMQADTEGDAGSVVVWFPLVIMSHRILSAVTDEVGGIGSVSDIFYEFRKISID